MEIPGSQCQVDSFKRGSIAYFLSHYHADHMANLRAGWSRGPLYASPITCRLLRDVKKVDYHVLREIEPGGTVRVESVFPVEVTAFEANHCPGAVMFIFDTPEGRFLHTGDFRYDPDIHAALADYGPFTAAYVDAVFADPNYVFPPQREAIQYVMNLVKRNPDKEFFLGIYTIGKTRILEEIALHYDVKFYVTRNIQQAYKAMGKEHLITADRNSTRFFGYSLGYFGKYFKIANPDYRRRAVVVIPTGWAVDSEPEEAYHYVPYSEHCDWRERREFIDLLNAEKVVDLR